MPKILENVREQILAEARREVFEEGYSCMTMRSVAKACRIALGTVYNYFESKDMIIAAFMSEDWHKSLASIQERCGASNDAKSAIECMYDELCAYIGRYVKLFGDEEAKKSYSVAFSGRHGMLCAQLASVLEPFCKKEAKAYTEHLSEFIVGSMLSWGTEGKEKAGLIKILEQFF